MAKREFIDRVEIDKIFYRTKVSDGLVGTYEKILDIKPITEQDIVKPYLDKLKKEILSEAMEHSGTGEEVIQAYVDGLHEAIKRIDNLLSEQGDTE